MLERDLLGVRVLREGDKKGRLSVKGLERESERDRYWMLGIQREIWEVKYLEGERQIRGQGFREREREIVGIRVFERERDRDLWIQV